MSSVPLGLIAVAVIFAIVNLFSQRKEVSTRTGQLDSRDGDFMIRSQLARLACILSAVLTSGASAQPFPAVIDLSELDGTYGLTIRGIVSGDALGELGHGGDIDGDGLSDIVIGASDAIRFGEVAVGEAYVVFGQSEPFPALLRLTDLDGSNGFRIGGLPKFIGQTGSGVAVVGDLNADGYAEFVVGVPGSDQGGMDQGEAYLFFGRPAFGPFGFLEDFNDATGVVFKGESEDDFAGHRIGAPGDVNGDGVADLAIGAEITEAGPGQGRVSIVFGDPDFPPVFDLASLNGTNGVIFFGDNFDDCAYETSGGADVNDDGLKDVIIGARRSDPEGRVDAGEVYVLYGQPSYSRAVIQPEDLDGTIGFVLKGDDAGGLAGYSVDGMSDFNGDGVDDFVIGAALSSPDGGSSTGRAYVVYGDPQGSLRSSS